MKSVIVIGDGMSDRPIERLGGKTPLMVARKPAIDRVAREGRMGRLRTVGETGPADSAVANLAVLGYDAVRVSQGRAVLEAASMNVEIRPDDVALRCNLICLHEGARADDRRIKNHSAGHISTDEAAPLIQALDRELGGNQGSRPVAFFPGISYRHLLLLRGGWASAEVECAPPHDHLDDPAEALLPRPRIEASDPQAAAATADRLTELYRRSIELLRDHPVNVARRRQGLDEATCLWTWSPGRRPKMKTLRELYGVRSAVISAVDLIMGLGVYAGMDVIRVPGATGLHDTNYEGKAEACLEALRDHDLVYVHVEASDEAAHARDLELKIRCIEYLDDRLVRPILAGLDGRSPQWTLAILPDHPTPVETGQHGRDPVPVAIWTRGAEPDSTTAYDEIQAEQGSLGLMVGDQFMRRVLQPTP
jgi:2,3-bisphosphoglycerate-independent phosphoglycerate mutase